MYKSLAAHNDIERQTYQETIAFICYISLECLYKSVSKICKNSYLWILKEIAQVQKNKRFWTQNMLNLFQKGCFQQKKKHSTAGISYWIK